MSVLGGRRRCLATSGVVIVSLLGVGTHFLAAGTDLPAVPVSTAPTDKLSSAQLRTNVAAAGGEQLVLPASGGQARKSLSILQIGDSHTAADLFTGMVRQILQEKFGQGGIGYVNVGTPHPGVRSSLLKLTASSGWSYEDIRRSARPGAFGLSGFNASTSREGEVLTFASDSPARYSAIEIEAQTDPDAGSVVIEIDDVPVLAASLAAATAGPRILEVRPTAGKASFRRLVVRTGEAKPVAISAVGIFREGTGVTYSSIGYPGATVDLLARFPEKRFVDGLRRLAPDVVVLAFGTNEGFDANLDPAAYRERYVSAIRAIRQALPHARLVMVGPPQGERPVTACKPAEGRPCPATDPSAEPPAATERQDTCPQRPPQLDQVREVQLRLAKAERIPFWDWWAIMPAGCGASLWAATDPALMSKDRVHFTKAGYRKSAAGFAAFLEPEVRASLRGEDAVPND